MDYDEVREAAQNNNTILLEYESPRTGKYSADREVEPYEIKEGFLWAYDIIDGSIKKFHLDGILSVQRTENEFYPRWPVQIF